MEISIRNAHPDEYAGIGNMMVNVYSQLAGFPTPEQQPRYYEMLRNVGDLLKNPETEIIVAVADEQVLAGAVVLFGDMKYYGSGGTATKEKNAFGFRLLAVDPARRGQGIASRLVHECIQTARAKGASQVIIHTTDAMKVAWTMYERIGFKRSTDLDFMQGDLKVYGFRYRF